ncbi:hypothetical protein TREMEDRAFT_74790 [Tremella mesenterica DSM 1558]|uniref:uncharacterized protein n=1 Tax=Tremella mesenterica (strain ATCC 24925 / CBS 8224 / DSM 1558 / NBRC 9311 / NRRL Y-6157 / RJB 2259-6 / UBC 559-6) TaxID=578456 RepID=UPI00032D4137|nr:uncharacterized protein TREMEDRAFT_74790 [Tremella mesenterica DSM 1558]EIW66311.1 hypothetical protein TREMEDRAFT_74790 [Tremella mesenterica DSM 1558]
MPRITKSQKEQGKRKVGGVDRVGDGRRRGFKVGPAHVSRDAYLGKVKKIERDLVERAKVKKSYAKILKQEGMSSSRIQDRSNLSTHPLISTSLPNPGSYNLDVQSQVNTSIREGHEDPIGDEGIPTNESGSGSRYKGESSTSANRKHFSNSRDDLSEGLSKFKRDKGKGIMRNRDTTHSERNRDVEKAPRKFDFGDGKESEMEGERQQTLITASGQLRALSPLSLSSDSAVISIRDLQRKVYPDRSSYAPSLGGEDPGRRKEEKIRHDRPFNPLNIGVRGHAENGGRGRGKGKHGQPDMGAKMTLLLEKIQRGRT